MIFSHLILLNSSEFLAPRKYITKERMIKGIKLIKTYNASSVRDEKNVPNSVKLVTIVIAGAYVQDNSADTASGTRIIGRTKDEAYPSILCIPCF